jgi:putative DNA primase/helicase
MIAGNQTNRESSAKPKRPTGSVSSKIPKELRNTPHWMGTRFRMRKDGKVDKPPYRVRQGQRIIKADKTNSANWATYEEAVASLERGEVDAIGFVLTEDDPFFVVDLDGVIDPETGEIGRSAAEIIHTTASYTELSCSKTGAHIVGMGTKPEHADCKSKALGLGIEVYDKARFLVVTGDHIGGKLRDCQQELDTLCLKLWPKTSKRPESKSFTASSSVVELEDAELLERARNARSGPKFHKLYDLGDTSGHASASEADFSLLNALIFWSAGDRDRICRLFEGSALYRKKDKHRSYVERSVDKALASYRGAFYQPRGVKQTRRKARKQEAPDPIMPYLQLLLSPAAWTGHSAGSRYKAFAGAVIEAKEHGIFDSDGSLRIGCDTRRLAEVAGTTQKTICNSGLPGLMKEKLLRTKTGKGQQATTLILPNPALSKSYSNKVATHFIEVNFAKPENALKTIQLLIRMRTGKSKHATLDRLGTACMFVVLAMVADGTLCGQTLEELIHTTGRRKYGVKEALTKLKGAGVVRESSDGRFHLTERYKDAYERNLEHSGIIYTEREQRRRHDDDRRRRDAKLGMEKPSDLRGKKRNEESLKRQAREEGKRRVEEERQKVGKTVSTFLADELEGVHAMSFEAAKLRWMGRGGKKENLWWALRHGPWETYRESDGTLCIRYARSHTPACECEVCGG